MKPHESQYDHCLSIHMYETGFERLTILTFNYFAFSTLHFSPSRHTGFNTLVKFLQKHALQLYYSPLHINNIYTRTL
jgi:hypothetical protein